MPGVEEAAFPPVIPSLSTSAAGPRGANVALSKSPGWQGSIGDKGQKQLKEMFFSLLKLWIALDLAAFVIFLLMGGLPAVFSTNFLITCAAADAAVVLWFVGVGLIGAVVLGISKLFGKYGQRFIEWIKGDG